MLFFVSIGVFNMYEIAEKNDRWKKMKNIAIKENHLYTKAYRNGERFVGKYVAVYVLRDYSAKRLCRENPRKEKVNRLGIAVSKKIGGAVERNRAKRIIRAGYNALESNLKKGYLVVISAREAINGMKSTDVAMELERAFAVTHLLLGEQSSQRAEEAEKI